MKMLPYFCVMFCIGLVIAAIAGTLLPRVLKPMSISATLQAKEFVLEWVPIVPQRSYFAGYDGIIDPVTDYFRHADHNTRGDELFNRACAVIRRRWGFPFLSHSDSILLLVDGREIGAIDGVIATNTASAYDRIPTDVDLLAFLANAIFFAVLASCFQHGYFALRRRRLRRNCRCVQCGYSLAGLAHPRCPECGGPFS